MVKEHEMLSLEYENLQKELDSLKSKVDNIDYFKWLEKELGRTLDKNQIVNYAKFDIKNEFNRRVEKNRYTDKILNTCCLFMGAFIAIFLWGAFTHPISNNIIFDIVFDIIILAGVTIISLNIETNLVEKKHMRLNIKYDNKEAYYLMQHEIPEKLQKLIEYSLRKLNAYYYKGFDNNELFQAMYYILYNGEDYLDE